MQNKILVTGGSGFIGSRLIEIFGRLNLSIEKFSYSTFLECDETTIPSVDTCIHLGGLSHDLKAQVNEGVYGLYRSVNAEGVLQLATKLRAKGCKRFIFISSIKVMGDFTRPGQPFSINDSCTPVGPYAESKFLAEQYLLKYSLLSGLEVVIIRPALVYGLIPKGNLKSLAKAISLNIPLPFGGIKNQRSFIFIDNLIDLIRVCCFHPHAENKIFLASDGNSISTPELASSIGKMLEKKAYIFYFPLPLLKALAILVGKKDLVRKITENLQVDNSYTHEILGWAPPETLYGAIEAVKLKNSSIK